MSIKFLSGPSLARCALTVIVAAPFFVGARAHVSAPAWQKRPLSFEDYPVRRIYKGPAARVRLDSPRARMFRTRLREDSRGGPNFAGRYAFVLWGCGTGCAQSAVVDVATGRVFFTPLEYHDILDVGDESARRHFFRLESRLLILTKTSYDREGSYIAYSYLFDGGRFRLLRKSVERYPEPEGAEATN